MSTEGSNSIDCIKANQYGHRVRHIARAPETGWLLVMVSVYSDREMPRCELRWMRPVGSCDPIHHKPIIRPNRWSSFSGQIFTATKFGRPRADTHSPRDPDCLRVVEYSDRCNNGRRIPMAIHDRRFTTRVNEKVPIPLRSAERVSKDLPNKLEHPR